ncbi:hypothetical protein [Streptomyces sp. CA-111067]|uniref:hypothetical protein n=1 Tax=Streptomyces sp. CA-111067 TaxID=3240046 RepID=UPI003D95925C
MPSRPRQPDPGDADFPVNGEPPIRSALSWPPCECPKPDCPLKAAPNVRREREESAVLRALRERVRDDCDSRRRLGILGRKL